MYKKLAGEEDYPAVKDIPMERLLFKLKNGDEDGYNKEY